MGKGWGWFKFPKRLKKKEICFIRASSPFNEEQFGEKFRWQCFPCFDLSAGFYGPLPPCNTATIGRNVELVGMELQLLSEVGELL